MKFSDLEFKSSEFTAGVQARVAFPNGYGASVIRGPYTYGGPEGLYELAVLQDGKLCYSTPITEDVIGHLTEAQVMELLQQIEALEPANGK